MSLSPATAPPPPSGAWSANTKLLASLLFLFLVVLGIWRFSHLLQPVIIAVLLAYLLHPAITRLAQLPFLNRAGAAVLVYLSLLVLGLYGSLWLGSTALHQMGLLVDLLPTMSTQLQQFVQQFMLKASDLVNAFTTRTGLTVLSESWERLVLPLTGDMVMEWDLAAITEQALTLVNPLLRQSSSFATNLARGTFNVLGTLFLIVILSLYVIIDIPKVEGYIARIGPVRSIQDDLQVLWKRFTQIWEGYLRGQVTLALLMFIVVSLFLGFLGVRNAVGLGLVAGAMEFLPVIGPILSSGLAIGVAIFQGTTAFGLSLPQYVVLVAVVMIALQVVEGNVLVPRVIGNQLRLHPLVVFLSVLMGSSLAGLLGAILAAPVAASLKLLATYTWYRVLDQPLTFLTTEEDRAPPTNTVRTRMIQAVRAIGTRARTTSLAADEPMAITDQSPLTQPLRFTPRFQDRVWGGHRLAKHFPELPTDTRLAEVWLLSGHPQGLTAVATGPLAGQTLPDLIDRFGLDLLGTRHAPVLEHRCFPLLFKLLDVDDWLSVQVHPATGPVGSPHETFGKTEMWVMTEVTANAQLILGLREGCTREQLLAAGPSAHLVDLLHHETATPDQAYFVPSGVVHALGPGVSLIEIQETSDTTYRLYDWDRPQDTEQPRDLHWDEAMTHLDMASSVRGPHPIQAVTWQGQPSELLVTCPQFQTIRVRLAAGAVIQGSTSPASFEVFILVAGHCRIVAGNDVQQLRPMDCILLPAALGHYSLNTRLGAELLVVCTP